MADTALSVESDKAVFDGNRLASDSLIFFAARNSHESTVNQDVANLPTVVSVVFNTVITGMFDVRIAENPVGVVVLK